MTPEANGAASTSAWSLFVQYPNREPVLRELPAPRSLGVLRESLEVFDDQELLIADRYNKGEFAPLHSTEQLYDGASLRVAVPRRRIFVSCGDVLHRQVIWYPGAGAEQIEHAIVKACRLPVGTPIELVDGDVAVVISATIPNELSLTVVPLAADVSLSAGAASAPKPAAAGRGAGGYPGARPERAPGSRSAPESPRRPGPRAAAEGRTGATPSAQRGGASARTGVSPSSRGGSAQVPSARSAGGQPASRGQPGSHPRARSATPQHGSANVPPGGAREGPGFSSRSAATSRSGSPLRGGSGTYAPDAGHGGAGTNLEAQPVGRASAPDEHCVHILAGHAGFVMSLCTVGDVLFTGSQDCNIMIWDLNNLQYIGTLPGHRGFVKCMAATLSKKLLFSGSQDKTIKVWSLETFSAQKTLVGHTGEVNSLAILEGPEVLISAGEDRSLRVWDLTSLTLLASLEQAHLSGIFTVAQLDSGNFLSASRDRTMKVWQASSWQAKRTLQPPHYDGVTGVAASAHTGRFFSCSRDRSIRRWDMQTYESDLQMTHAHGDWLTSLALAPSESVLFSGGKDCVVKVWDTNLRCQDLLSGHRGPISALLAVDSHLFSASHDRTVRVWRVDHFK